MDDCHLRRRACCVAMLCGDLPPGIELCYCSLSARQPCIKISIGTLNTVSTISRAMSKRDVAKMDFHASRLLVAYTARERSLWESGGVTLLNVCAAVEATAIT